MRCGLSTADMSLTPKSRLACHVSYVLQAEPTVRAILTACRLAQSLRRHSQPTDDVPIFDFWLATLRQSLDDDPFWGPEFWRKVEPRASSLERGIYAMAYQCCWLAKHLASFDGVKPLKTPIKSIPSRPNIRRSGSYKKSSHKIKLVGEEAGWMQNILIGCWTTLMADAKHLATSGPPAVPPTLSKVRSSTLP